VPAGQNSGQVPVVTAALRPGGAKTVVYTLTPNDYKGRTQTVTVKLGRPKTVSWPTNQDGYYDVMITASSAGGFRRRYAGASPERRYACGAWDLRSQAPCAAGGRGSLSTALHPQA
jgi:hypothetical protein